MIDITKLSQINALAEHLNFNRAAERCHTSPSTISRNLKIVEDALGTKLFERDNRSVSLTAQGERFLSFARETLQQWETIQEAMLESADQLQGNLSLYCSVTASYSFLYDILTDFRKQHPLIGLTLHTGDPALAIERVAAGTEDIAIAAKPGALPPQVVFKPITLSPLLLIQAKGEQANTVLPDEEEFWRSTPFILSEMGITRDRMDQWFRHKQVKPQIYAQVAGHEAIVSMVSLGFGVGLIPQIVLDNSPLASKVEPCALQPELEPYEVGVVVLEKRLKSPIVQALWEQIEN